MFGVRTFRSIQGLNGNHFDFGNEVKPALVEECDIGTFWQQYWSLGGLGTSA